MAIFCVLTVDCSFQDVTELDLLSLFLRFSTQGLDFPALDEPAKHIFTARLLLYVLSLSKLSNYCYLCMSLYKIMFLFLTPELLRCVQSTSKVALTPAAHICHSMGLLTVCFFHCINCVLRKFSVK